MRHALAAVGTLLFGMGAGAANAQTSYLGQLIQVAFNFCPLGYTPANGQLLPIAQNQALFAVLGTTYGGDGVMTFALPAVRPTFAANGAPLLYCIALQGIFPSRN